MEEWKPEDPKLLEFDLNECKVREFCEVFGLDLSVARGLYEYRQEIQHIFQWNKILKLKGMSDELTQQWNEPKPQIQVNLALHKILGLPTDVPASLSQLLQAVCKITNGSVVLMSARVQGKVLQSASASVDAKLQPDSIASQLQDFLLPFHETLAQKDLSSPDLQILSFENVELILIPTSGFHLIGIEPMGRPTTSTIELWRALALELRRRHPPKMLINNHAEVFDTDIAFDCPKCQLRIAVTQDYAGVDLDCPRCKEKLQVPAQTTSFSSYTQPAASA